MDSFEFNKIAGGMLGTLLFVMALGVFSNFLFYRAPPAVPGYELPAEHEQVAANAHATPPKVSLPVLLAKANAKKGKNFAQVCTVCHNFEKGAGVKIGPPLYGVVGRPVASVAGFSYSDSLKHVGGKWTFDKLFKWIEDPKAMASNTKMTFPGEPDPAKRADILAYLDTLSDHPVPLPAGQKGAAPAAAPTAPAAGASTAAPAPQSPSALLAAADPKKGKTDAVVCTICHNFEKGGGVKIGPPLYGVVGRTVASVPGFSYSDSLKRVGGKWTLDKLFKWIADPKAMASDTKMTFSGEPDPKKRADIVAYLNTLSDHPLSLRAGQKGAAPAAAPMARAAGAATATPAPQSPSAFLATADPKKGKTDAVVCTICHTFAKGGGVKIGPPLYGVVGRPVASVPGFPYSDSLKRVGGTWTLDKLSKWIADPKAMASDTKMTFSGEPDAKKRADIVAYLSTLSDHPAPLPAGQKGAAPAAAPTAPAAGASTAAPAPQSPSALLAAADPKKGKTDAVVCTICHNFEKGGGVKIGPPLYGVVGRTVASVPGFSYSDSLKRVGGKWTLDKLFKWIADPKAMASDTKMTFSGEPDPKKRADIVAYLNTLSDHPLSLRAGQKGAAPAAAPTAPQK